MSQLAAPTHDWQGTKKEFCAENNNIPLEAAMIAEAGGAKRFFNSCSIQALEPRPGKLRT